MGWLIASAQAAAVPTARVLLLLALSASGLLAEPQVASLLLEAVFRP